MTSNSLQGHGHGCECRGCEKPLIEASERSSKPIPQVVRDALVALWTDRRSDKHAELYAEAMAALNDWKQQEC